MYVPLANALKRRILASLPRTRYFLIEDSEPVHNTSAKEIMRSFVFVCLFVTSISQKA